MNDYFAMFDDCVVVFDENNKKDNMNEDSENTTKEQMDLTIGSDEYTNMINSKRGLSGIEQKELRNIDKANDIGANTFAEGDGLEDSYKAETTSNVEDDVADDIVDETFDYNTSRNSRIVRKKGKIDGIVDHSKHLALETETLDDDFYVANEMAGDLYDLSYDDGVSESQFENLEYDDF